MGRIVTVTPLPIYVASCNTRDHTELCVRSLHRHADVPFELVVGDSDSRDGSREMLDQLASEGWLRVEHSAKLMWHAAWLDRWLAAAHGPYALFCDSDIQFLRGCLGDMRRVAERTGAAVVSPGLQTGGPYRDHRILTRSMPRPSPWLMLVDVPRLRSLNTSYAVVSEPAPEYPEGQRTFDVGSLLYQRALEAGMTHAGMGLLFRRSFRHYENASWGSVRPVGRIRRRSAAELVDRSLRTLRKRQPGPSRLALVTAAS